MGANHDEELKRKCKQQLANATDPIEKLRLTLLCRGSHGIKGFGRTFRIYDDDGNKQLSLEEFNEGMRDYGVKLDKKEIEAMFYSIDKDHSDSLNFDEFLMALRPPMSKRRVDIINEAFNKMDKTGDNQVTVDDLKGVYNAKQHPKYQNGEWTEERCLVEFLNTFDTPNEADGVVTREEFINYYSGVSASIDDDAYFDLMMRNCWKLD